VRGQNLANLFANADGGMEGERRLLENQSDSAAANLPQFLIASLEEILTFEQYSAAANVAIRRKKAQNRRRERAFARARFAKNAENFSGHQVEAHSRQNGARADFPRPIGNLKILDVQNG